LSPVPSHGYLEPVVGPSESASQKRSDGRSEQRFPVDRLIEMTPWNGADSSEDRRPSTRRVRLSDCSAHGLGLEDTGPMQPGQQFVVYLQLDEVVAVLYAVRHCSLTSTNTYRIGAQLCGFVSDPDRDPNEVVIALTNRRLV